MCLLKNHQQHYSNTAQKMTTCASSCAVCRRSLPPMCRPLCRGDSPEQSARTSLEAIKPQLCEACKKFHYRCQTRGGVPVSEKCTCASPKDEEEEAAASIGVSKCRPCRFKLCDQILSASNEQNAAIKSSSSTSTSPPQLLKTDMKPKVKRSRGKTEFYKIPCAVCGYSSSGVHFGVISCEGCKIFFGRATNQKHRTCYLCLQQPKQNWDVATMGDFVPPLPCDPKSKCRRCRLQRCYDAGMTTDKVFTGRYSASMRQKIEAALAENSQAFEKPQLRRPPALKSTLSDDDTLPDSGIVSCTEPQSSGSESPAVFDDSEDIVSGPFSTSSESQILQSPVVSTSLPVQNPAPIEIIVEPLPQFCPHSSVAANSSSDSFTDWLVERCVQATVKLAPIAQINIVITPDMSIEQVVAAKADAFVVYVRSISEFLTALPGITNVAMQDRMMLYLYAFFPVLAAQLSLNFDHACQSATAMHRGSNCSAAQAVSQATNENDFMIKSYLCYVGNQMASTVSNLREFAVFCALLCFSPDHEPLRQAGIIPMIRNSYEMALSNLLGGPGKCELRVAQFHNLLSIFRQGVEIFYGHMADIPNRCQAFHAIANTLVLEFQQQFLTMKQQQQNNPAMPWL